MAARVMSPPTDGDARVDVKMEEEHTKPALTPPTSEGTKGNRDDSGSELSDLDPEESPKHSPRPSPAAKPLREPKVEPQVQDDGEILPDHYYEGGRVPVFKPVRNSLAR